MPDTQPPDTDDDNDFNACRQLGGEHVPVVAMDPPRCSLGYAIGLLRSNVTLSTAEASLVLGVHPDTLRGWLNSDSDCDEKLAPMKVGRNLRWPCLRLADHLGLLSEVLLDALDADQ